VTPKSELGQLILILYALVGIPLMLMFLANIGDAMAKFFRIAYGKFIFFIIILQIPLTGKGCCYCCNKRRGKEYDVGQREYAAKQHGGDVGDMNNRPKSAWSEDYKGIVIILLL
jgi:hypothetical protein